MPKEHYDNTNRGQIWKNERREKDTHAHYRGDINIDGVNYWLDAWKVSSDHANAPVLRFRVRKKGERKASEARQAVQEGFDKDIPF